MLLLNWEIKHSEDLPLYDIQMELHITAFVLQLAYTQVLSWLQAKLLLLLILLKPFYEKTKNVQTFHNLSEIMVIK
jgi:hypothetical protein